MLKKIALLAVSLLIVALMLAAVGCGSESTNPVPTSSAAKNSGEVLVPQKASMLARISIGSIVSDKDTRDLYNNASKAPGLPATFDELLKRFQDTTGLDLKDFKEATLFGDIAGLTQSLSGEGVTPSGGYLGAIVNGTFKSDELIAAIEKGTGQKLESEAYKGYDIYAITDTSNSNTGSLVFLDDGVLVIGSSEAIKDVIDVKNGDEKGLSGDLLGAYEKLDGSLGKLALNIPSEWLSQIPDEQDISGIGTLDLKSFKEMRMATAALDKAGSNVSLEIRADFSSSASASSAKDTIDGVITVLQGLVKMTGGGGDKAEMSLLAKLLNSLQLSVSDNWLTLHLGLTAEQIGELVPMLQGTSSGN